MPLYRHDTQRNHTGDFKQLYLLMMAFTSSWGAVVATHTWWLDEWLVCITDVDKPNDTGEIAEAIASGAEVISAEENVRAGQLGISGDSMGIDVYILWMYERASCKLHIGVSI